MSYIKITLDELGPLEKLSHGSGMSAQIRIHTERLILEEIPPMVLAGCVELIERTAEKHGDCKDEKCAFKVLYIPLAKIIKERNMQYEWNAKLKKT